MPAEFLPDMFGHRLRMNSFLNKWLDYLDVQGHAPHTVLPRDAHEASAGEGGNESA